MVNYLKTVTPFVSFEQYGDVLLESNRVGDGFGGYSYNESLTIFSTVDIYYNYNNNNKWSRLNECLSRLSHIENIF